jgi:hypothetical protein
VHSVRDSPSSALVVGQRHASCPAGIVRIAEERPLTPAKSPWIPRSSTAFAPRFSVVVIEYLRICSFSMSPASSGSPTEMPLTPDLCVQPFSRYRACSAGAWHHYTAQEEAPSKGACAAARNGFARLTRIENPHLVIAFRPAVGGCGSRLRRAPMLPGQHVERSGEVLASHPRSIL